MSGGAVAYVRCSTDKQADSGLGLDAQRASVTRRDLTLWRTVIDELANALQVAIGHATQVRRSTQAAADDAVQLEASIARAVAVLKQLQPPSPRSRR